MSQVVVIGAGLAGCEAAWQLAERGVQVRLLEMKPGTFSPAHRSEGLAELVCSNSLRSEEPDSAIGALKGEMRLAGSLIMRAAEATRVPAGKALAVNRELFSAHVTEAVSGHENIEVERLRVDSLDAPELSEAAAVVLAAGPLAGDALAESLRQAMGGGDLYFYDAIAPIVWAESVDMDHAFWGSRYRPEESDYLNCPLTEAEYDALLEALLAGETVPCREFEREVHFEGCLPVEEMAARGRLTLAYGPLKPVGLVDPRTGEQPFAVVQLRAENAEKTMFNLVGFQTKLRYPEQRRVFGLIPALARAEYVRMGSIHRNTYVNSPQALTDELELRDRPGVFLAGQITGVEGYLESAACGLWMGLSLAARIRGRSLGLPPRESVLGGLLHHLRTESRNFQPSNANFGLTPPLNRRAGKRKRKELYAARALQTFEPWLATALEPRDGVG